MHPGRVRRVTATRFRGPSVPAALGLGAVLGLGAAAQVPPNEAKAEYVVGVAAENEGRLEEARAHFEAALRLAREAAPGGTPEALWQQAACLESLGSLRGKLGETQPALEALQQALELYDRLEGTQWERANCLCRLGALRAVRGERVARGGVRGRPGGRSDRDPRGV